MRCHLLIRVILILFTGICPLNLFASNQEDIILIGNKTVADSITKREIKEIFLGNKTRWENNSSLTFVLFKEEQTYETFLREYVGKTASQYRSYWKMKVFNGTGRMPIFFKDEAEVMAFVSENPGAIGFVVSGNIRTENVKIIKVNP